MNKAKQRQLVLKEMRKIYYPGMLNRVDWMGYLITDDNKPSYHHIVKREELAEANQPIDATVENGAYLGKRSHEMLHQIELIDHDFDDNVYIQLFNINWNARKMMLQLDFNPRNFRIQNGKIYYIPFIFDLYKKSNDFTEKDLRLWFYTKEFEELLRNEGILLQHSRLLNDYEKDHRNNNHPSTWAKPKRTTAADKRERVPQTL